jgi:hypothetical protein
VVGITSDPRSHLRTYGWKAVPIPVYPELPIAENYPPVCHNQRNGGNRCNLVIADRAGNPKKQGGKTQKIKTGTGVRLFQSKSVVGKFNKTKINRRCKGEHIE